ncbi:MAG: prepilin-type N-terminal cleavage/methylation domain-containing protein, partial [Phycisphaerae bacterium]|nr:prepilin-type N-terminal cleavage/methylation domain-containing protein [Phycisphaerae bacterium]
MIRRAFSLIELLLAVFILAIGIISITALFPAGMAQQQMASDDQLGPAVADHALNVVRSKVRPEDFGSFEQFGIFDVNAQSQGGVWRPSAGDWSWMRPAVLTSDISGSTLDETGAVDIFANYAELNGGGGTTSLEEFPSGATTGSGGRIYGIPYNASKYAQAPPVAISQKERFWPMVAVGQTQVTPPQYVWDVMFRRFGGKMQVAVFVYRVVRPGGASGEYVATPPVDGSGLPPVPYRRMTAGTGQTTGGPSTVTSNWQQPAPAAVGTFPTPGPFTTGVIEAPVVATADNPSSPTMARHQWQLPGQWLLDNNGSVMRVSQGRR